MPEYTFEDTTSGAHKDFYFSMSEAPSIGDTMWRGGKKWRRIVSLPQATIYDRAHVSHQLPRKGTGIERVWDKFTPDGKPYFEGQSDVDNFKARSSGSWDYD